jgi:hypothetical protein
VRVKEPLKLSSPLYLLGCFVSEAGSEQSTNCPLLGFLIRGSSVCRLDLNSPPTPVGGISEFSQRRLELSWTGLPKITAHLSENLSRNGRPKKSRQISHAHISSVVLYPRSNGYVPRGQFGFLRSYLHLHSSSQSERRNRCLSQKSLLLLSS